MFEHIYFRYYGGFGGGGYYEAQLSPDRKIIVNGIYQPFGITGMVERILPPQEYKDLVAWIRESSFSEMLDRYDAGITDIPTTVVTVKVDGLKREVEYQGNEGPSELRKTARWLNRLVRSAVQSYVSSDVCTVADCAKFLGVSETTVILWIAQKSIQACLADSSTGGEYLIPKQQFREMIGKSRYTNK